MLKCEHPVYILHPSAKELICKYGNYYYYGMYNEVKGHALRQMWFDFPYHKFNAKRLHINEDTARMYYVCTPDGECLPLFIPVPCGKCALCRQSKRNEWANRCKMESQVYDRLPVFITLTYNNENLPDEGVNKRDVQLYLKRLRIQLERSGHKCDLRYYITSEYGSKRGRPHYHGLLWNLPTELNLHEILGHVECAWDNGFAYCKFCKDSNASYYCSKYMAKTPQVPTGKNDVFFMCSRGNSKSKYRCGIGFPLVLNNIDEYYQKPEITDITYTDKFSGKLETMPMPEYFKNKIFPSFSKLVPRELRTASYRYQYLLHMLYFCHDESFITKDDILTKYENHCRIFNYLPHYDVFGAIDKEAQTNRFFNFMGLHYHFHDFDANWIANSPLEAITELSKLEFTFQKYLDPDLNLLRILMDLRQRHSDAVHRKIADNRYDIPSLVRDALDEEARAVSRQTDEQ